MTDDTGPVDLGIPGTGEATEIGEGGFGRVYRVHQPTLNRTVAIKVLNQALADEQSKLRFDRESRAMGMLSGHPNIVTLFDSGITGAGQPYLMMDFQAGGSLADRLDDEGPLPPVDVAAIGVQTAGALATAHDAGVLHRDIKPENILVSRYGEPQLGDFGIARLQGAGKTQTGVLTASFAHVAPELLDGADPTPRSDIYSFGSSLFTLLWGAAPFVGDGNVPLTAMMVKISRDPPPDLRERGVPEALAAVVERCLAKSPDERYQMMIEVGRALQDAQRALGVRVSPLALATGSAPAQTSRDTVVVSLPAPQGPTPASDTAGDVFPPSVDDPPADGTVVIDLPTGVDGPAPPEEAVPGGRPPSIGTKGRTSLMVGGGALVVLGLVGLIYGVTSRAPQATDPVAAAETTTSFTSAPADTTSAAPDDAAPPATEVPGDAPSEPIADLLLAQGDVPEGWTVDDGLASELDANPAAYLCSAGIDAPTPVELVSTAYRGGVPGPRVGEIVRSFATEQDATAFMDGVRSQIACLAQDASLAEVTDDGGAASADAAVSYIRPGASTDLGVQLVFVQTDQRVGQLVHLGFPEVEQSLTDDLVDRLTARLAAAGPAS